MPFHQANGAKVRPAVVLLDVGDDDFRNGASHLTLSRNLRHELLIRDWQATGLNTASTARVDKITILSKASMIRVLGQLQGQDREELASLLCRTYCQWIPGESPG